MKNLWTVEGGLQKILIRGRGVYEKNWLFKNFDPVPPPPPILNDQSLISHFVKWNIMCLTGPILWPKWLLSEWNTPIYHLPQLRVYNGSLIWSFSHFTRACSMPASESIVSNETFPVIITVVFVLSTWRVAAFFNYFNSKIFKCLSICIFLNKSYSCNDLILLYYIRLGKDQYSRKVCTRESIPQFLNNKTCLSKLPDNCYMHGKL